jgi:hypothetical protein
MHERVNVRNKATEYSEALNGTLENNVLAQVYFSAENMQIIQNALRVNIYKLSDGKIERIEHRTDPIVLLDGFEILSTREMHIMTGTPIPELEERLDNYWKNGKLAKEEKDYLDNWRIIGVNSIGIYNFMVGSPAVDNLSYWSEPGFYRKYFVGRKLNIVNSSKNDGVVTIKSISSPFGERTYQRYRLDPTTIILDKDFILKVTLKTDVPTIYSGQIQVAIPSGKPNTIQLVGATKLPSSIKPGVRISMPSAQPVSNQNFFTVGPIQNYTDISSPRRIFGNELVIYEGQIYKCTQFYDWSATASIFPSNIQYWALSDTFPVVESLSPNAIFTSDLQLASNVFYYTQGFTQSVEYTYGSSIAK